MDKNIANGLTCLSLGLFDENLYVELIYGKSKKREKIYFDTEEELLNFVKELKTKECNA